ncbi:MAG TPA: DNA-formamidopyrimidine glycosylase family protein [Vicinamibacterales bacterium]|nr:DNA-formamidopyrimidine glycosylase family protein [Vicinamibacterales bacterium]
MPEGDTIFRAARTLHRALAGKPVASFESVFPALTRVNDDAPIAGRTIERIHATGKHLLMRFSGDLVLRTHMRMNGSWHIYRPGEKWQRSRRDMRIVIATTDFVAVGFNIPVAEFLSEREAAKSAELRTLGPDVLADEFDSEQALANLRERSDSEIAEALLNQRVLAGLGNVYKSEILFMCRINPFRRVQDLTDADLTSLVEESRRMLTLNVSEGLELMTTYGGLRRTTGRGNPSDRLWVYGRARLPCRRCETPIRVRKQGRDARLTYFCPTCQPPDVAGGR